MSTFRHPAFPHITNEAPDEKDDEMVAAGWIPVEGEPVDVSDEETTEPPPPAVRK